MKPHVVAVTGGRDYGSRRHVNETLDALHKEKRIDLLVHGGCTGADRLCDEWATENGVNVAVFPVRPSQWEKQGLAAGPRRNRLMLTVCRHDFLVVFPGGTGTNGCRAVADELGIQTFIAASIRG